MWIGEGEERRRGAWGEDDDIRGQQPGGGSAMNGDGLDYFWGRPGEAGGVCAGTELTRGGLIGARRRGWSGGRGDVRAVEARRRARQRGGQRRWKSG